MPLMITRFALTSLLLMLLISCLSVTRQDVFLADPILAKSTDENSKPIEATTTFKTTDKRIYATICVRGATRVRVGARWYFGDRLITDEFLVLGDPPCGAWYLESPPGGTFPAGDYRVEIYLVKSADKIAHFKVIE